MNESVYRKALFSVRDDHEFFELAKWAYSFQYEYNPVYRQWCDLLKRQPSSFSPLSLADIPFLPISFFKTRKVMAGLFEPEEVFLSSGTTGMTSSRHYIKDLSLYEESFLKAFTLFYGDPSRYCILGLLPSYLQREHSSLIVMVRKLIACSGHSKSGFYLNDLDRLRQTLLENEADKQETLLLGVTFALLDFAEQYDMQLAHTIVMETGGMKGRREEMTRNAVHDYLKERLSLKAVHSEYGMCELLSQCYSDKDGLFKAPPWVKILIRDPYDPLSVKSEGRGSINIVDLANLYSCPFIATEDLGRIDRNGYFRVMGRMDHADMRGCNLLVI